MSEASTSPPSRRRTGVFYQKLVIDRARIEEPAGPALLALALRIGGLALVAYLGGGAVAFFVHLVIPR